jgi:fructose transport system permease protein
MSDPISSGALPADTAASAPDASAAFTQRSGPLATVQRLLHRYPTLSPAAVLVLSTIVFWYFSDGKILKAATVGIMLQQAAVLATLAVGQTLIILTAGVDLAVGTGMILTHLVVAKVFSEQGWPAILALLGGLVVGLGLGAFHGFLVTRVRLPPFITTLGTFYIFQSLALLYGQARTIPKTDLGDNPATDAYDGLLLWTGKEITFGDRRTGLTITVGVVLMLLTYVVFAWVLSNTAWGSHVYSTGDDMEAARLAGINVTRVIVSVYMVAGALYAFGGWIQIGRSLSASHNAAVDINLETITAVVIGGTSLFGGRGRLWGTLVGALVVVVFRLGLKLSDVDPYWQNFAIGALILVAVGLDQWIRKVAK